MARVLRTLTLIPRTRPSLRFFSSAAEKVQLIELDLDAASPDVDVVAGVRRLEDAIHGIIVRRSAPAWLPFVPGSSYWVPPRQTPLGGGLAELIGRIANPMSDEEVMALTTARGWPSSEFFIEGLPPLPVEENDETNSSTSDEKEET